MVLYMKVAFSVQTYSHLCLLIVFMSPLFTTTEKTSSDLVIPGHGRRWEPAGGGLLDRVSL